MSDLKNVILANVTNLFELKQALPVDENVVGELKLNYKTLILFVAAPLKNNVSSKVKENIVVSKNFRELSKEAEENVYWVLENYLPHFDENIMFIVAKLKRKRWCPEFSEFRQNNIISIKTLPTLMWFGENYALQGVEATELMLIKEFLDIKLKGIKMDARYLFVDPEKDMLEKAVQLVGAPDFKLEFLDWTVEDENGEEAKEGDLSPYEVMLKTISKMYPRKLIRILEEEYFQQMPRIFEAEEDATEVSESMLVEPELILPNIKKEIIKVERDPTPKQKEELAEAAKAPKPKKKGKGKKGKGKKGKGKKGKGKKGKGKKGKGKGGKGKGKGGKKK